MSRVRGLYSRRFDSRRARSRVGFIRIFEYLQSPESHGDGDLICQSNG
jgi:hypothetical protein